MEKKAKNHKNLKEVIKYNKMNLNYIFLGVGLTLFITNITSLISFVNSAYSFSAFNVSIFSAILIIIMSVYNIFN